MRCGACGHDDPHVKNGGCGADLMREGPPPYFVQCMCDGKSGSRIVRFWSDPPFDPAARVAALACPLCGRLWTSDQTGHFHSATIAAIQPPSDPAAPLDVEAEIAAALAKQAEEIAYEFRKQTPAAPLDVERLARALENISSNRPSYFSAEAIAREYALATTDLCQHMIPAAECRVGHAKADPSDPAAPLDVLHDIVCSHANRPAGHAFNFDPQGILSDCRYLRAALATEEAERE